MDEPMARSDAPFTGGGGGFGSGSAGNPRRSPTFTLASVAPVQKTRNAGYPAGMPVPPPAHLSASAAQWWETTIETYVLQEHHLRLLQLACEAWDRAQAAREMLGRDGLTVQGADGGLKTHPAVAIERDARLAVARLVRELDLDTEPPVPERFGPPAILSNNRGGRAR
jgi:P27 family predicted phage terminase small subunit